MKYTQNYNLRKPEDTDPADIQDLNYNADAIDGKLKEIEDWEAAHLQASNPHGVTAEQVGTYDKTAIDLKDASTLQAAKDYTDVLGADVLELQGKVEDIEDGTTVVKRAEQDEDGNSIKDTYATVAYVDSKAGVISVNGRTGVVELDAEDVGALPDDTPIPAKLSDLDNDEGFVKESDLEIVLLDYVEKEEGKGLSTNDYTTDEKNKLSSIDAGAQVNVIETVKVNGVALPVSSKAVDITIPDVDLTDYYTKTEIDTMIGDIETLLEGI